MTARREYCDKDLQNISEERIRFSDHKGAFSTNQPIVVENANFEQPFRLTKSKAQACKQLSQPNQVSPPKRHS